MLPYATRFSALARESYVPASCPFAVLIIIPARGNSSPAALYHMVQGQRLPPDKALGEERSRSLSEQECATCSSKGKARAV